MRATSHNQSVRRTAVVLLAAAASQAFAAGPTTRPAPADVPIRSATGGSVTPLVVTPPKKAAVLLFVATECPISNGYAPEIARIVRDAGQADFSIDLVYSDPDLKPADVLKHQSTYALPGTPLLDGGLALAHAFGIKVTPAVVIVGPGGRLLYRGAIDDQYAAVGRKRFAATQHYLGDALRQVAAGQAVATPETTPIGCELE